MKDRKESKASDGYENAEYRDEAIEKYGYETVTASHARVAAWNDKEKAANFKEGVDIARDLAAVVNGPADSAEALELAGRQYLFVNKFWDCSLEAFRGLGDQYVEDERFAAYYENFAPGLAVFFRDAIHAYVERKLQG